MADIARGLRHARIRGTTWVALVCALTFAPGTPLTLAQPQPPDLEVWRRAVDEHHPGEQDQAAAVISTWPTTTINVLLRDWTALSGQWRSNRLDRIRRMQLDTLHIFSGESMARFVKRAAMLHADVAILFPRHEPANGDPWSAGTALLVDDGQHVGYRGVGAHWSLGRALLDTLPKPAEDDMVRRWYIASSAYLQAEKDFADAAPHLSRARDLFPADGHILFLSGVVHEHYASPEIQSAIAGMRPTAADMTTTVQSSTVEWQMAEEFYRRAVAADSANAELQLRFGRVTGLLGHHREAIATIASAKRAIQDRELHYDACLFLGRERHQMKEYEPARAEFREASQLFPDAQSPKLALSQIAAELGDRDGSISELVDVVGRTHESEAVRDPWPDYMFSHLRMLPVWLGDLYRVIPARPMS